MSPFLKNPWLANLPGCKTTESLNVDTKLPVQELHEHLRLSVTPVPKLTSCTLLIHVYDPTAPGVKTTRWR